MLVEFTRKDRGLTAIESTRVVDVYRIQAGLESQAGVYLDAGGTLRHVVLDNRYSDVVRKLNAAGTANVGVGGPCSEPEEN
jgi:hypothetical protein